MPSNWEHHFIWSIWGNPSGVRRSFGYYFNPIPKQDWTHAHNMSTARIYPEYMHMYMYMHGYAEWVGKVSLFCMMSLHAAWLPGWERSGQWKNDGRREKKAREERRRNQGQTFGFGSKRSIPVLAGSKRCDIITTTTTTATACKGYSIEAAAAAFLSCLSLIYMLVVVIPLLHGLEREKERK